MEEVRLIEDVETLKVVAEPTRFAILELLTAPRSVSELAAALDVPRTRLYHHVELLRTKGLVEQVDERRAGALTERVYAATARTFRPSRGLFTGGERDEQIDALTTLLFDATKADLRRSLESGAADLEDHGGPRRLGLGRSIALPQLVLGLLAGVLVDRWNRRQVMITSDLLRAGLVLGFLAVTTADRLWLLYVLAFASSAAGTFFNPARGVLVAEVLPADRLLPANSLSETSRVVAGVAGVALAGAVAGESSLSFVFVVDAASFLVSAALVARVPAAPPVVRDDERAGVRRELVEGLRLVFGSRLLRGVVLAGAVVMLGLGAVNVLLVPFVVDGLGASETWFGALEGAQVAAMVLAGVVLATAGARLRPTVLVSSGLVGIGLVVAAMAASTHVWHLVPLLFAAGWFVTPVQASVTTILQTEVPTRLRGRAGASFSTLVSAASLASMALAGVVAAAVGIRTVFVLAGLIAVCAGLASAVAFRPAAVPAALEPR